MIIYSSISFLGTEHIVLATPGREPNGRELTDVGRLRRLGCGSGGRRLGRSKRGPEGLGRAFAYPDVVER